MIKYLNFTLIVSTFVTSCRVFFFYILIMRSEYLVLAAASVAQGLPQAEELNKRLMNGLGKTPVLGWNSWV
jgi:hypothetical protein